MNFEFSEMFFFKTADTLATASCTLREACHYTLAKGKNTRSFNVLDQNEFISLTCHSVQRARQPRTRRAISLIG